MKTAILSVSFGTSYAEARERSLDAVYRDLCLVDESALHFQAYTSNIIIRKLSECGIHMDTVQEAVQKALDEQVSCLYVVPTHMIPGIEYQKMARDLEQYRSSFQRLEIATSILHEKEDVERLVPILRDMLHIRGEYGYILMGHGTEDDANIRYAQMNDALLSEGLANVRIASVEAQPDLNDAIFYLKNMGKVDKVVLHPFLVVAGDHAFHDMAGASDSYVTHLQSAGYEVETILKGLGEYPQFRRIYTDKLRKLLRD